MHAPVRALVRATSLAVALAGCGRIEDLPPLGDSPSDAELARHAARYCERLDSCSNGMVGSAGCTEKMLAPTNTKGGRHATARLLDAYAECLPKDCSELAACCAAKAMGSTESQLEERPEPPGAAPSASR